MQGEAGEEDGKRERAKAEFRGVTDALRPEENEGEADNNVDKITEQSASTTRVTPTSPSQRDHSTTQTSRRSATTRASDLVDSSIGQWFVKWFPLIRQEHRTATREQAAEHTERMQNAYENGAGWVLVVMMRLTVDAHPDRRPLRARSDLRLTEKAMGMAPP